MARSYLEAIEAALAGEPGRLRVVFLSSDKYEQADQIGEVMRQWPPGP
jgi:hypothetical protein